MDSMLFKGLFLLEMCSFYSNMAARGTFLKFCCALPAPKGKNQTRFSWVFQFGPLIHWGPVARLRLVTRSQY